MNPAPAIEQRPQSTTLLRVEGMNCNNCARKITDAVQSVAGVTAVMTDVEGRSVTVKWKENLPEQPTQVIEAMRSAGYKATLIEPTLKLPEQPALNWQLNLWLGSVVTASLMVGEWVFDLGMAQWFQWTAFALASVVQFVCGAQFYRGAWRQLRVGSSNMDTLVAIGSTTAFGYSAWALLVEHGGHVYFMESSAIITLISVGHWLEARVSAHASGALKALMQLAPRTARLVSSPGTQAEQSEREVPIADLKPGDLIALRPGDHVPTDGEVVNGNSVVNEAMLTGESLPVDKSSGAKVFAGTVNMNGRLLIRVTTTGESTVLAHIVAAVQRAQNSRANIQRIGDRVSNVFVPVVVCFALATGLWWGIFPDSARHVHEMLSSFLWQAHPPAGTAAGFIIAAAMLIVACPCAMGLATPAAVMAAANAAARRGILIRDGVALEKAGKVTAVVFDKTGTLTTGELSIEAQWTRDDATSSVQKAKQLAASLARHSTHPISKIMASLPGQIIELKNWREVAGAGVEASKEESTGRARLGSLRWLRDCGADLSAGEKFVADQSATGGTVVGLTMENELLALFVVKDKLKPRVPAVVAQLQHQGLNTFLLSGDTTQTATAIARQCGIPIENVFAEVRPEQKAEFIQQLQSRGERVAFVGDGINDAPALTQADLGVAVSRATDVARESADMILLRADIEAVPEALGLARAALRTIKQNLFWAFFYNALGVPLAALGFMSPVLCAAAMGISDLIVIGNALRLTRWKPKHL